MTTIVAGLFMSLDGVVDGSDGWQHQYFDETLVADMNAGNAGTGALLLGRRSYEGYEDLRKEDANSPVISFIDATPTYVVSSTLGDLPRENGEVVPADRDRVAAIADGASGHVLVLGSPMLVRWLIAEGLLGALNLYLMPIVVGEGQRLFDGPVPRTRLHLESSTALPTGAVGLRYVPLRSDSS